MKLGLHMGRQAPDALDVAFSLDGYHFSEQGLHAPRTLASQVGLTALGAHDLAGPGNAKPLRGGLMGLQL